MFNNYNKKQQNNCCSEFVEFFKDLQKQICPKKFIIYRTIYLKMKKNKKNFRFELPPVKFVKNISQ